MPPVEYTKEQQLYRNLAPSGHTLFTFCIRISAFNCFHISGLVQVFSGFIHNCYKGSCPESEYGSLRMMATTVVKFREVQQCWETSAEAVVPVPLKPIPVHPSWNSTVAKRYRYRYRHVIFARIEQEYDSNARVRSSFNHQLKITMEKGIKAKGKVENAAFDC